MLLIKSLKICLFDVTVEKYLNCRFALRFAPVHLLKVMSKRFDYSSVNFFSANCKIKDILWKRILKRNSREQFLSLIQFALLLNLQKFPLGKIDRYWKNYFLWTEIGAFPRVFLKISRFSGNKCKYRQCRKSRNMD